MSGGNPPSSAAAARNCEANQSLKRSVQAAFDGSTPSLTHFSTEDFPFVFLENRVQYSPR